MYDHRRVAARWSVGLGLALVAVVLASATVGPVHLGVETVVSAVWGALPWTAASASPTATTIVVQLRLPRILLAAVVGAALSAAGAIMQAVFRNPMADPSIIGVSGGAAVGAVAAIVAPVAVLGQIGVSVAAFVGALTAATAVYLLAYDSGRTPVATLLLAGVAVQTFLGAVVSLLLVTSGEALRQAIYWLLGDLHAATWSQVALATAVTVPGVLVCVVFARDLNVLHLGAEDARALGVPVERTRLGLLAAASLLTATAVAVAGIIGFVGLVVPHVVRLLVGPDNRVLLPTSALAGGAFLVAADTLARAGAGTLPVGVVTALVGAPFFLWLLRRREVVSP